MPDPSRAIDRATRHLATHESTRIDRMESAAASFRTTLDLFDTGVGLMRQNLRRSAPTVSEAEIDARLQQWLRDRPGAADGDCPGRVVNLDARRV